MQGHPHGLRATRLDADFVIGPIEAVAMISALPAKLTPYWPPKTTGTYKAEYMTVQANNVLANGERSIHDGMRLALLDRGRRP